MTLTKLSLKKPRVEDLEAIVALDQICLEGLWTLAGYRRELESPNSSLVILTLPQTEADRLIGCACFWAVLEEAHITLIAVHPQYQGQGLGQLLLYALLQNARMRKLERATLEVKASNARALSLYEKFGFQVAGRRKGYYQKTGEDALILWRSGLDKPEFAQTLARWDQEISTRLLGYHWTWELLPE